MLFIITFYNKMNTCLYQRIVCMITILKYFNKEYMPFIITFYNHCFLLFNASTINPVILHVRSYWFYLSPCAFPVSNNNPPQKRKSRKRQSDATTRERAQDWFARTIVVNYCCILIYRDCIDTLEKFSLL